MLVQRGAPAAALVVLLAAALGAAAAAEACAEDEETLLAQLRVQRVSGLHKETAKPAALLHGPIIANAGSYGRGVASRVFPTSSAVRGALPSATTSFEVGPETLAAASVSALNESATESSFAESAEHATLQPKEAFIEPRSFGAMLAVCTVATFVLNVTDVLWLITCVDIVGFRLSTSLYTGAVLITALAAWLCRDAAEWYDRRHPNHPVDRICEIIGPALLLLTTLYLFYEWCRDKWLARQRVISGYRDGGDGKAEASESKGLQVWHFVLITLAACIDNFALDMWLLFEESVTFAALLLGGLLGCVAVLVFSVALAFMPAVMRFVASVPLFVVVGILTLVSAADLLIE